MIDRFCLFLINKIKIEMPEIDDEKAEIINYGLHLIIAELPKNFIVIGISYLLGIIKLTIFTIILLIPYKAVSGGIHLKTHLGCLLGTSLIYCGIPKLSNLIIFHNQNAKFLFAIIIYLFGIIMIYLYAPADTENVPILRKKERKIKKVLSYVIFSVGILIGVIVKNNIVSNIILFSYFLQSILISKFAYKITNNKYSYEVS